MSADYPILEHDDSQDAVIEPSRVVRPLAGMPERCVLPIYHTVVASLEESGRLTPLTALQSSMGPIQVHCLVHKGTEIAVAHPGIGAPFVSAVLEELIALGGRKFIACGSAGVLDGDLARGSVVVPSAAIRDEGTSYHYAAPAREIEVQADVVQLIQTVLEEHGVPFRIGKTWTTDAVYRETKLRIADRKSEGCLTVEMECAALVAVAAFRGVRLGQFLAVGDDVSGAEWHPRRTAEHMRFPERLFWCAAEVCLRL